MFAPPRSSLAAAAVAVSVLGVAGVSPALTPGLAAGLPAPQVATGECITGATPERPAPISTTKVVSMQGRVDIRGSLKVKRGAIGPLVVKGCASGIKPLVSRTYVLVKAPKSNRYIVSLTRWTTLDGSAGQEPAPNLATEDAFSAAARPLVQVLGIPGIKGVVYGPLGSPFALMAKTASGRPYPARAKLALATNYIATGGYAQQPGL